MSGIIFNISVNYYFEKAKTNNLTYKVDPNPKTIIIKKNKMAQTCAPGMSKIASGKVMKLNPGPEATTSETSVLIV